MSSPPAAIRPIAVILLAQVAPPTALRAQETSDTSAFVLPEVTVTAERGSSDLFATPLAVTTVQPTDLFGANGYRLDEALFLVPGVVTQSRAGGQDVRVMIRGFGARGAGERSNAGTTRGIRVLVDGIPETEPDGRTSLDGIDLASAERIEVVRSNASALWGNAAGGVISVSTMPTGPGHLEALAVAGGSGLRRYAAKAGGPVGRGRLWGSFVHTEYGGWRQHSAGRRSLLTLGAVSAVGPSTSLGVYGLGSLNRFEIPGPLTAEQVERDPSQANATYLSRDERRYNRLGRIGLTLEHGADGPAGVSALLFVTPKLLQRSERGTFRDFTRYHVGGNLVGRLRLRYGESVGAVVRAGVDEAFQDGAIRFYSLTPEGTRGDTLREDQREAANNLGGFVQHALEVGQSLVLVLGARYDVIRYSFESHLDAGLDASKQFARLTPQLGLNLRLTPRHSVYANVGGGVEAPAGNETDPASTFGQDTVTAINPLLDPISSTTYEIGTRHALAGSVDGLLRAVSYDAAVYLTGVRNEIVPYRGGRFYFTAGQARRAGAELAVRAALAGGVTLASALTWSDNEYTRYQVDSVHYARPGRIADYSGNRIVGVPDLLLGAQAAFEPAWLPLLRLQLDLQSSTGFYADDANTVWVPGYTIASLTAGLGRPVPVGTGMSVRAFVTVDNLLGHDYVASAYLNPDVVDGAPVAFEPGLPRELRLSLELSHGGSIQ
ncbi:MAG TPA: TonB-dependent receptor [Gemmatimonadales bacterium]|nr:TonB-dependent receptor [Gemmatimonadales bacterium]